MQPKVNCVAQGSGVEFEYQGIDDTLVDSVTRADVRWTCGLLSRLTDTQWHDAFRAGGYTQEQTARYARKIQEKIAQARALAG